MGSSLDQAELRHRATLVDVLRGWVQVQPERTVFTFLADGETRQQRVLVGVFFAAPDLAALADAIDAARASGEVTVRTCPPSIAVQATDARRSGPGTTTNRGR